MEMSEKICNGHIGRCRIGAGNDNTQDNGNKKGDFKNKYLLDGEIDPESPDPNQEPNPNPIPTPEWTTTGSNSTTLRDQMVRIQMQQNWQNLKL